MLSARESFLKNRILYWICWGAILLLAVLFRILPIRSGLPYSDYIDEGHVLHQTIDAFNHHSLDVYWYGLPALSAYSAGAALLFYDPLYRHFHGHRFQKDLPNDRSLATSKTNYDLITPVELIIADRAVTACLSIATVILAGVIAAQLANNQAGLSAMLLVTVCPALVTRASIVIVDTFATFFVLVTIYFCERLQSASSPASRHAGFAGLATGFAFASKYPAATVGVIVITTIVTLPVQWRRRLQLLIPAAGGLLLGILLGAPMTFFKPATVWHDVVENIRAYGWIHSPQGYLAQAVSTFELGVPLLLAGFAGIILLQRRKTRAVVLGWALFAAILIASFMGQSFRPFRSLLPLVPPLCVAAGIAFCALIDWGHRGTYPWLRWGLTVALIGGCVVSLGLSSFRQVQQRMAHQDSRIQAVDWLQRNATKGETVLGIGELFILPSEWKRIEARSTVVPWFEASTLLERQPFDYIVTGDFDLRYASDPRAWSAYRDAWKAKISTLPVRANFGQIATPVVPYLWRTNDERILILKGNAYDNSER
jgi:dolichyl-phosphate-mannose-protein mannosyltransferase